ncbi:MAG: hypothetical protein FJ217_12905 [Ignavibacteria bacterium]|nr:hypothetical protein [Ignavibacteria bacterium]
MLLSYAPVSAQLALVWKKDSTSYPYQIPGFNGSDTYRALAYNHVTDKVLLGHPNRVYVLNAATGVIEDSLNMTGISGGTRALNKIDIDDEGVIYGCNLVTGVAADTVFKLYRWQNQTVGPTVAFEAASGLRSSSGSLMRLGDAFDVAGSGAGTVIYVSGNSSTTELQPFSTSNGTAYSASGVIPIGGQEAGAGVAQVTPGGNAWVSRYSSGNAVDLVSSTGATLASLPVAYYENVSGTVGYFAFYGREYLASAITRTSSGGEARLYDITGGMANALLCGATSPLGSRSNGNATSAIGFKKMSADTSVILFVLGGNNGVAAFRAVLGKTVFRSVASGDYSNAGSWISGGIVADGDGIPDANDDVFVAPEHTVTLQREESVGNLILGLYGSASGSSRINTGPHKLNVYGTMVATTTSLPSTGLLTNTGSGAIRFAGGKRDLFGGLWAANPPGWNLEIALSDTGTISGTNVKAGSIALLSGVLNMKSYDLRADSGSSGTGTLKIAAGASLIMGGGSIQRVSTASSTSHFSTLIVDGKLVFNNAVVGSIAAGTIQFNGTVEYAAPDSQTLVSRGANSGGTDPVIYNELKLSGDGTKTLSGNTTVNGSLILAGTAQLASGAYAFVYGSSATLVYAGSSPQATGNVEFPASGGPKSLTIDNELGVSLHAPRTVPNTLTLTKGALNASSAALTLGNAANIVRIAGSLVAAPTFGTTVNVSYGGAGVITTGPELPLDPSILQNLTISQSGAVTLASSSTVNGTLALTNGRLITGSNLLTMAPSGSVARTDGFVEGNLRKYFVQGTNVQRTFEVGSSTVYAPVAVTALSVTTAGTMTVRSEGTKHPSIAGSGISVSRGLKRHWSITGEGLGLTAYDAVFTFRAAEVDTGASTSRFIIRRYASGAWNNITTGVRAATSIQALGVNGFGDFSVGESAASGLELTSGNDQTGPIGTKLVKPLVVTIRDDIGEPLPGIAVTFSIASTPSGATDQALSTTAATTDSNGQASTYLTLGDKPGAYGVLALSPGLGGSLVIFTALATALSAVERAEYVPSDFALHQNFPNPFNPSTTIQFDLKVESRTLLEVYDVAGRLVDRLVDQVLPGPSRYSMRWDAGGHASGVYLLRLIARSTREGGSPFVASRRLVIVK